MRAARRAPIAAPRLGVFLERLAVEIEEDRTSLLSIMGVLGVGVDLMKLAAGWGAEKAGRLKLNGRLFGYSPLSRVVELEVLALGVRGKLALWRALDQLSQDQPELEGKLSSSQLAELVVRAECQLAELEEHRLRAVSLAFDGAQ